MFLLAAFRFPFLIHAGINLVFALLFCRPVSFLDIEYHAQSHFSSYHVLLLSTIFFNHVITAVRIRLSSSFLKHQHSEPYSNTGTTKVSYSFTFVSLEMPVEINSLLNLFTFADVSC